MFKGGDIEPVIEVGLYDRVGFPEGRHRMGKEMVLTIQVIKDEFSVVIGGQFQVIAGGTFDGDGRIGETDGNVVSL